MLPILYDQIELKPKLHETNLLLIWSSPIEVVTNSDSSTNYSQWTHHLDIFQLINLFWCRGFSHSFSVPRSSLSHSPFLCSSFYIALLSSTHSLLVHMHTNAIFCRLLFTIELLRWRESGATWCSAVSNNNNSTAVYVSLHRLNQYTDIYLITLFLHLYTMIVSQFEHYKTIDKKRVRGKFRKAIKVK